MAHPIFVPASRLSLWGRMAAGTSSALGNSIAVRIKRIADGVQGVNQNIGDWAAWWYAATGDNSYAQKAYNIYGPFILAGPQGSKQDQLTDNAVRILLIYDLLYNWLVSQGLEAGIRNAINNLWVGYLLDPAHSNLPNIRTHDVDAADADYWLLALCDQAFSPSPGYLSGNYWDSTYAASQAVGGLDYTGGGGANYTTLRNIVYTFGNNYMAGGRGFYSSSYTKNLERYDFLAVDMLHTALGTDHFTEWTNNLVNMLVGHIFAITPDWQQEDQWGDVEPQFAHVVYQQRYADLLGMYAGLLAGDGTYGPIALAYWNEFNTHYPNAQPTSYYIFTINPEVTPSANWRQALATAWNSNLHNAMAGPGIGVYRPKIKAQEDASSPAYFFHGWWDKGTIRSDHYQFFAHPGSIRIYHKGAWGLDKRVGYNTVAYEHSDVTNGTLLQGLSGEANMAPEAYEAEAVGSAPYAYFRAASSGTYYGPYFVPGLVSKCPAYVNERRRSVFCFPSADGTHDTMVVFDRLNCTPPTNVGNYLALGSSPDRQKLTSSMVKALKMWVWEAAQEPAVKPNLLTWQVPAPTPYQTDIAILLPVAVNVWKFAEGDTSNTWPFGANPLPAKEAKWQVREWPTTDTQFAMGVHVVNCYDTGQVPVYTLVNDNEGLASGAFIQRGVNNDTLCMDGVNVAGRVISSQFTFTITGKGAKVNCFFGSLDTSKTWHVKQATRDTPLHLSSNGIGQAVIWCAGGKLLTVYPV